MNWISARFTFLAVPGTMIIRLGRPPYRDERYLVVWAHLARGLNPKVYWEVL